MAVHSPEAAPLPCVPRSLVVDLGLFLLGRGHACVATACVCYQDKDADSALRRQIAPRAPHCNALWPSNVALPSNLEQSQITPATMLYVSQWRITLPQQLRVAGL